MHADMSCKLRALGFTLKNTVLHGHYMLQKRTKKSPTTENFKHLNNQDLSDLKVLKQAIKLELKFAGDVSAGGE